MIDKALFSSQRADWETPQALFDALNAEFHFTLDPASTDANAKCEKHYTEKENGLIQSWENETVFAILHTGARSRHGFKKRQRKPKKTQQWSC